MRGLIIGRYDVDLEWQIDKIIDDYKLYQNISKERILRTHHSTRVYFANGDIWETIKYNPLLNAIRGKRVNIIYIDHTIPEEDVDIIKTYATAPPFQGYKLF